MAASEGALVLCLEGAAPDELWLRLRDERAGAGSTARRPLSSADVQQLRDLATRYRELLKRRDLLAEAELRALEAELLALGCALYSFVDQGSISGRLEQAKQVGESLRFEVRSQGRFPSAEEWALLSAPWELLADPVSKHWAQDHIVGFSPARRLGPPSEAASLDDFRLGVVFMAALPEGQHDLDIEEEELATVTKAITRYMPAARKTFLRRSSSRSPAIRFTTRSATGSHRRIFKSRRTSISSSPG